MGHGALPSRDHLMEWNIRIRFALRLPSRPRSALVPGIELVVPSQCKSCRRSNNEQPCGKRPGQAGEHLEQTSRSPSRCSSSGEMSNASAFSETCPEPVEGELGFSPAPLKRKVSLCQPTRSASSLRRRTAKSKSHRIFNLQGENGDKQDNIQRTGEEECEYD